MIENKFFNNSTNTTTGKPKFMPPQKRHILDSEQKLTDCVQTQINEKTKQAKNNLISKPSCTEEIKPSPLSFKRNCRKLLTPWGSRHTRSGYLEKYIEEEEKALFKDQNDESDQPVDTLDNYENLNVDVVNKSSAPVPEVKDSFEQLNLSSFLLENIKRLGYQKLTKIQRHAIPIIQQGVNLMACSQTGSGKTASFLVPIIQDLLEKGPPNPDISIEEYRRDRRSFPIALILAPTRELALQIYHESRKFSHLTGILTKVIYGGKGSYEQQKDLEIDGCDILVATPGKLIDFMDKFVDFSFLRFVVLDEADRMLDMGFEPQIRDIMRQCFQYSSEKDNIHISMISATFPKQVNNLAEDYLRSYVYIGVGNKGKSGSVNNCIKQQLVDVRNDNKNSILFEFIGKLEGKIIVFCGTKRAVSSVYKYLNSRNLFVVQIHGDLNQTEREEELSLFKNKCSIMIATDVASRGLDIPDVTYVINYDLPTNIESYVHRIGRTGRIGKAGTAISFVDRSDENMFLKLYKVLKDSKQEIPEWFEALVEEEFGHKDRTVFGNGNKKYNGNSYRNGKNFGETQKNYPKANEENIDDKVEHGQGFRFRDVYTSG